MKKIDKGAEPNEWLEFRQTAGVTEYVANEPLRNSLLHEQGYICAYCMRRIPIRDELSNETSRIDHVKCREFHPELQLTYTNMVVCCPGAIDGDIHCDKLKDNKEITFSLFSTELEKSISYGTKDGLIKSSDKTWDKDLNEVLNLNNVRLKQNRNEVINGLVAILSSKGWSKANIRKELQSWQSLNKKHKYKPYCGVVIWYLQKKLKK